MWYRSASAITITENAHYHPRDDEYRDLFVGDSAGTKLKSSYWNSMGTNSYGFSALPGGSRRDGRFRNAGELGYWWSATEYNETGARFRDISHDNANVFSGWDNKGNGFSVRCVLD